MFSIKTEVKISTIIEAVKGLFTWEFVSKRSVVFQPIMKPRDFLITEVDYCEKWLCRHHGVKCLYYTHESRFGRVQALHPYRYPRMAYARLLHKLYLSRQVGDSLF